MPVESSSDALAKQICAAWQFKLVIAVVLPIVFCVPYFLLEHFPIFPIHRFELSWVDRQVPFRPKWAWVYQSFYLIVNLVPWLGRSRDDMRRFAFGFLLMSGISFAIFFFFPIIGPRPQSIGDPFLYRLMISYDGALNAFPSLHAALLVYTLEFGWRLANRWISIWMVSIIAVWAGLIIYSTLATKEHYAVDLLAGGVLAVACDAIAWHSKTKLIPLP